MDIINGLFHRAVHFKYDAKSIFYRRGADENFDNMGFQIMPTKSQWHGNSRVIIDLTTMIPSDAILNLSSMQSS